MENCCNKEILEILEKKIPFDESNGQNSLIYKKDNYIIKEIKITRYQTYSDIFKEINIQQKANDVKVAPKIHYYKSEEEKVSIIMENLEENNFQDLTTYYKEKNTDNKKQIEKNIAEAITKLYKEGIYHLDLHSDNIFISRTNLHVQIIDYGLSEIFKEVDPDKKNTTRKKPYIHRVIEIIDSDDHLDLTKYIAKDGTYIKTNTSTSTNSTNDNTQNLSNYKSGGEPKKRSQVRKIEKRKTKNKTSKAKNHKRKTRKRVKRKQI